MAAAASIARRCRTSTGRIAAQPELLPGLFQPRADPPLHGQPGQPRWPTTTARSSSTRHYDAAYIGRGNLYRKAGRIQDAFNDFQKAIELDTTDPRAYHNRGLIYQQQGQHALAIEDFSTAISLSPDAAEPYNGRGLSYLATNDDENAFADFNMAIKLDGKIAESWANQALVYERRGDKAKAAKSYWRGGPARSELQARRRRAGAHARLIRAGGFRQQLRKIARND